MPKKVLKKKRIRNPEITRAKLLQATVNLVAEKGHDALSLKEVAQRANVSRSVTYLHFEDRDHLLEEARAWIASRLQDGVERFDASAPLYERILYTTRLILEFPEETKVMFAGAIAGEGPDARHPMYPIVLDMLTNSKRDGKLRRDADLEILTFVMLGSNAATLLLAEQHKDEDIGKLAARFAKEWSRILEKGIFIG